MANASVKIEFSEESRAAIADMIAKLGEIQETLDRIGEQYVKQMLLSADRIGAAVKNGKRR